MSLPGNLNSKLDILRTPYWYQDLSDHTFPTIFLRLKPQEVKALADGEVTGDIPSEVQARMKHPMSSFPGNCFVFTDLASPTDTERFKYKNGAVYSPASAWRYLAESGKIRKFAGEGLIEHICIRPFRRMTKPREFRLFIKGGKLRAMSQYWLIRHFRRLDGRRDEYWNMALKFVDNISWLLPDPDIVMDIYFTSDNDILIIDFNAWGEGTDPLMLKSWDIDWNSEHGIKLIEPPKKLSGDVSVSF
jgi:hypothetical protein